MWFKNICIRLWEQLKMRPPMLWVISLERAAEGGGPYGRPSVLL